MSHRLSTSARLAKGVRRSLLGLLLASYLLGLLLPGPGEALRSWELGTWAPGGVPMRFSLWMVAVLLFCGAASTDLGRLTDFFRRPIAIGIALLGVWLPPVLLVIGWGALAHSWGVTEGGAASTGLLLGLALTAAMPVANSAVGWTQQSSGALAWAIGLVVLSISLSPWIAPGLLWLMGLTLSAADAAEAELLMARFSGAVFALWVITPTLLGFLVRHVAGPRRIEPLLPWFTLATAAALLLLNYANASMALPRVAKGLDGRLLLVTLVTAASLPIAGLIFGWCLARLARLPAAARDAWGFSLSMKNTGLALSLADTALGEQPVAVLVILTVTLAQHAVASIAHEVRLRRHHPPSSPPAEPN